MTVAYRGSLSGFWFKALPVWRCKVWIRLFALCLAQLATAQTTTPDTRKSGLSYLSPSLQALQADASQNPASLWVERGQVLMQVQCAGCHAAASLNKVASTFPKLNASKVLINLEDQIASCLKRVDPTQTHSLESERILSLSAALHQAAKGEVIQLNRPAHPTNTNTAAASVWQDFYNQGEALYTTRMGRINLACAHCHDDKVGAQMRGDVVSQAQPTGFPIYRMAWQGMGSMDRRLRACYSGVQAPLPVIGSQELRVLELFLKVRAEGMALDGPSVRR